MEPMSGRPEWLVDECDVSPSTVSSYVDAASYLGTRGTYDDAGANPAVSPLALKVHDIVVLDNKKLFSLFGGADVRLDIIAVPGNVLDEGGQAKYFTPTTMRFNDVGDNDRLALDDLGLLAYYGWPTHFLNFAFMMSRDRKDALDLAGLLRDQLTTKDFTTASAALLGLGLAAPAAAAVTAAIAGAAVIADIAYRAVAAACGSTIGIYRGTRLAYPDDFGRGRNPANGAYRAGDFSFWYEVIDAAPPDQ
jgi:hypothetical protein